LAPHHLDQDRHLELAASRNLEGVRALGGIDAQGHVRQGLALEPLLELARGHVAAFLPRERGGVDREDHAHGGLVDDDAPQSARALVYRTGNSSWSSCASRSMNRS